MKSKAFVLFALSCILLSIGTSARAQLSFFHPPTFAGSGYRLFIGDFNGDGKSDLLYSDGTMNFGNGDGTFIVGPKLLGDLSVYVTAVADFNGDGKLDVLDRNGDTVLLGNGDGTFVRTTPMDGSCGENCFSGFMAEDLNGDGRADLVRLSGTASNGALVVYLGNGDGTFQAGVSYELGLTSILGGLSLADFNGDNVVDIAVSAAGEEIVLLGNGDGTFQSPTISAGASSAGDAAVGDFNGDGKLDLVLGGAALLGNGDGTFQAPLNSGIGGGAPGDFNHDGKLDLISGTRVYLGNGDGTFSDTSRTYLVESDSNTVIGDFNADGKLDLATGNTVLLGNGNGTFQGNPSSIGAVGLMEEWDVTVGDFDNNGTIDVAVVAVNSVTIFVNDGTGQLFRAQTYTLQSGYNDSIVAGDFNNDGNLDLIALVDQKNGDDPYLWSYSVLLGNGDATFRTAFYPMGDSPTSGSPDVVVNDFNNDGKLDFVVNFWDSRFLGTGDGTFTSPIQVSNQLTGRLVSADFNRDGNIDIATTLSHSGTVLLFGDGDGSFQAPVFPPNLQDFYPQFTADLNHDGVADLISSQVALGTGDGAFNLLTPFSQSNVAAIADINGDGNPDAVYQTVVNDMPQTGVMLGNGDGTFGADSNAFFAAQRVLVADMNSDGRPDLVFVAGGRDEIGVVLNTTKPGFELYASATLPATITPGNSAASSVSVIANFGFNKPVTLSCAGLPNGSTCAFTPQSVANSAGNSELVIATSSSTAAGTYSIQIQGAAGSVTNSAAVSLVVQAIPDFSFGPATGSVTSQKLTAGQTATFALTLAPSASFTGTVNLTCAITPNVSGTPTCSLPSSVQIGSSGSRSFSVSVGTTAPVTTSALYHLGFPSDDRRLLWALILLGTALLCTPRRKRISALAKATVVMIAVELAACGGNSGNSSSSLTTPGTPAGTYTTTITATSGTLSHSTSLNVVVQ